MENGVRYLINFGEGLSTGIFLDQRENRRRLLGMKLAGKSVLNCFAYTCAFSVAAAQAGAVTTSVDLSKNYLDWGKANFAANDLECGDLSPLSAPRLVAAEDGAETDQTETEQPDNNKALTSQRTPKHQFLAGDVFEWLKRLVKRAQKFDVVILDPPTFSTTKQGRRFQAERDYGALAASAMPLVARGGWLLCSTNQRTLAPDKFEAALREAARLATREITAIEFVTLPPDFRVAEGERAYLKTFWLELA